MLNFWTFCNNYYGDINQKQRTVLDMEAKVKANQRDISDMRRKVEEILETNKSEAKKRKQYQERIEEMSDELSAMVEAKKEITAQKTELVRELEAIKRETESIDDVVEKDEVEGRRLKAMLRSEDVKKELEVEIEKLK